MAEAPATFSESWYRIAGQRVYLRAGVRVQRQRFRGERWIVLQNPFSAQYFRLRPAAYEFVGRLRPDRTVHEVWQECVSRHPDDAPGQEAVLQLLAQLYAANLLHYKEATDTAALFERFKKRRQRELSARWMNLMFMRFPLLDPDRFLARALPALGPLLGRLGAVLWLVVVGLATKVVMDHFPALRVQGQGILDTENLPLLYGALVLIKTIHEFGHAFFCKKFGGEVHVMGILLMIFTPIPYVDASSSWGFRRRWQRALVGAGGMIAELFVAALATFVWAYTGGGAVHSLAYNVMFIASVSTLAFNANPLLRFDGYYILSDLLEIPNLSQQASGQLRHLWERYVFGVKNSESPARTRREALWLGSYGVASGIYRVIVFAGVLLVVADRFLIIGMIMALVCLVSWVTVPAFRFIRYLAASPRLQRVRLRAIGVTAAFAAVALVLLAVIPFPRHFRAPGVAKATERTEVVNEVAGVVGQILAVPGPNVTRGQPLLQLWNHRLELELAQANARRAETEARIRLALGATNADLKPLESSLTYVSDLVAKLTLDKAALTIVARHDGIWVAPRIREFVGRQLERGSPLGLVVNPKSFEFVATVEQADADAVFAWQAGQAEVRLRGQAGDVLAVSRWTVVPGGKEALPSLALGQVGGGKIAVSRKDPGQAVEPFFEIHAQLTPTGDAAVLDGRSGVIRFELKPAPLLPRWLRRLNQLLQKRYKL